MSHTFFEYMKNEYVDKISYAIATISNISLAYLYGGALFSPLANASFILHVGIFGLLIEFLSIHSSAMLQNTYKSWKSQVNFGLINQLIRFGILLIYLFIVLYFGFIFGNWYVLLLFTLGLIGKFSYSKYATENQRDDLAFQVILFILSFLLVSVSASFWPQLFPFPLGIELNNMTNWEDIPIQAVLGWGTIYYAILALYNLRKVVITDKYAKFRGKGSVLE